MTDPINATIREYHDAFKLVLDALENACAAFDESKDYPITHQLCIDAQDVVQYLVNRDCTYQDSPVWPITVPDVKSMVDAINNKPECCNGDCNQGRDCPNREKP